MSDYITDDEKYNIKKLTLTGEINGTDIRLIRDMSQDEWKDGMWITRGKLQEIDLSGVKIVEGGEAYCESYQTTNDILGTSMFENCNISTIILPNSIKSIEQNALAYCKLTSITIPKSVNQLGRGVFNYTPLASIQVEEGNSKYRSEGNAVYEKESGKLILGCASTVIPEGVTVIGNSAFGGCSALQSIYIRIKKPEEISYINDEGFKEN